LSLLSASDYDDFNISFRGEYVLCNLKAEFIHKYYINAYSYIIIKYSSRL